MINLKKYHFVMKDFFVFVFLILGPINVFATADVVCPYLVEIADKDLKTTKNLPKEITIKIKKNLDPDRDFQCQLVGEILKVSLPPEEIKKITPFLTKNKTKELTLYRADYEKRVPVTKDNPGGYVSDVSWSFGKPQD